MYTPAGPLPFPGQDGGPRAPLEGDKQAACAEQVPEAPNRSNGVVVFEVLALMCAHGLAKPWRAESTM